MQRSATLTFFVYVVIEGALRKWALPGLSNELFVLKDVILGFAFAYWMGSRDSVRVALQPGEFALWAAWVFITVGYAAVGGFGIASLVGLRYYLVPLPLLVLVPAVLRDMQDLNRLATRYLWIALAVAALGAFQYVSPLDSAINQYARATGDATGVASFGLSEDSLLTIAGDRPRITGTFSYISPYAVYLEALWFMAWAMLLQSTRRSERLLATAALVAILANMAMTGSRAPLLLSLVLAVPFAVMARRILRGFWYQFGAIAVFLAVTLLSMDFLFDPFEAVLERNEGADDSGVRILGTILSPLSTFESLRALGEGIGLSFQGFKELGVVTTTESAFDEIFNDRVGIELGAFGYILALAIKLSFITKTFLLSLDARTKAILYWTIAALCCQLDSVWQIPVYNSVAAIFYFSSIGLMFWLRTENDRIARGVVGRGLSKDGFTSFVRRD